MNNFKKITYIFWGLGLITSVIFFILPLDLSVMTDEFINPYLWLTMFFVWVLTPYLFTFPFIYYTQKALSQKIVLGLTLILFLSSVFIYADTLNSADPQTGLLFIFIPLYQLIPVALLVVTTAIIKFLKK